MRYDKNHFLYSLLTLFFSGIFMLLNVPCKAQECNGIFHRSFPIMVCAGDHDTITIGYNPLKDIELNSSEPSEQIHIGPGIFLPDGIACGDDNSCIYSSSISVSGYSGTITSANDIKYVRLNLEHELVDELNIRLKCPSGSTVNILFPNPWYNTNRECYLTADGEWIPGDGINFDWPSFGVPYFGSASDESACDTNDIDNQAGIGWDYCWSNNDNSGYNYAFDDGRIYRDINNQNNIAPGSLSFDSTHIATLSQFYKPDQSFSLFADAHCDINGPWTLEIIDFGSGDYYNGYLFDWEIVFDDDHLHPTGGGDGGNIDNIAVVIKQDYGQIYNVHFGDGDTSIVFHAPSNISETTTFTDTLQFFDHGTLCWDTTISFVVTPPVTTVHYDTICAGESITLNAAYNPIENILFNEGFSSITQGNDHGSGGSNNAYDNPPSFNPLGNFPNSSNVYRAGGHLRIGNTTREGYISSTNLDLSSPYSIKLWLRGWNHASEDPYFYLKVDGSTVLNQNIPISAWNGSYKEYSYNSTTTANANSTITIGNTLAHQRFFIDSVVVLRQVTCQYAWNTGASSESITVTPSESSTYYVLITPSSECVRIDTFHVIVRPRPTVTFDPCGGTCDTTSLQMNCQAGITLPDATPCATDYEFAGWSTAAVDPAVNSEPTPLYYANENYLTSTNTTLYAVYKQCTNPDVCTAWKYWSYPFYTSDTSATACNSFDWYEHTNITASCDNLTHTFTTAAGCDSVVTLHLTINDTVLRHIYDAVCLNNAYDNYNFSVAASETGTAGDVILKTNNNVGHNGCDSTTVLHLSVKDTVLRHIYDAVCLNNAYDNYNFSVTASETATAGLVITKTNSGTGHNGCDSTTVLHLSVKDTVLRHIYDDVCLNTAYDNYNFSVAASETATAGLVITKTNSGTGHNGCDSTTVLHLSVKDTVLRHIYDAVCLNNAYDNYNFSVAASETGTVGDVILKTNNNVGHNGCDSTTVLHLSVRTLFSVTSMMPFVSTTLMTTTTSA